MVRFQAMPCDQPFKWGIQHDCQSRLRRSEIDQSPNGPADDPFAGIGIGLSIVGEHRQLAMLEAAHTMLWDR
jgi:hypothetical protein